MLFVKPPHPRFLLGLFASLFIPAAMAGSPLPWATAETRGLGYEPYFLSAIQTPAFDTGTADDVRYGHAVALDGDWLLVGVPDRLNGSGQPNGAAFLYQRQGADWVQRRRIQFAVGGAARCGHAVALKNTVALIGCPSFSSGGMSERGRTLIYRLDPAEGDLTLEHTLLGETAGGQCGYAVAVDGTGLPNSTYVAMGCPGGDVVGSGSRGLVNMSRLVFEGGSSWGTWGILSPESEGNPVSAHWRFGAALAMERVEGSSPRLRLLVGMPGARPDNQIAAGLAFLYERPLFSGNWELERRFARAESQSAAEFGHAVAIAGSRVAIGAPGAGHDADTARSGMVYRYITLGGVWATRSAVGADMAVLNPSGGSRFGHAVAIADGELWVGQPTAVANENLAAVWRYSYPFTGRAARLLTDIHQGSLERQSVAADGLGYALSVDGQSSRLAVGGPLSAVDSESATGLAFVYQPPDRMFADRFRRHNLRPGAQFRDCEDCPAMIMIPGGSFSQGSPVTEPQSSNSERPQRTVNVPAFALAQTPVTFDQWDACVADGGCTHNPSDDALGRGDRPVIHVNWNDAQQYVTWLSDRTGHDYRLASESEWEYAARAGTIGRYNTGDCINSHQASFGGADPATSCPSGITRLQSMPVASFAPNAFGLFDIHGHVLEWVQDCWNADYVGAPNNGTAWMTGDCGLAATRGGALGSRGSWVRSARRVGTTRAVRNNFTGFRVAMSVEP